ncbi:MAG: glycosyltransferase [Pirellula sp.]
MPFIRNEFATKSRGGTELMCDRIDSFLSLACPDAFNQVDIYPSRIRNFDSTRNSIYYLHDLPQDPECAHLAEDGGARFDCLVFVSNWQQQVFNQHHRLSPRVRQIVIPNAIVPIPCSPNKWSNSNEPIRLIYHTTPHRGLELLNWWIQHRLGAFQTSIARAIAIDVFSSFNIYGLSERDEPYQRMFDELRANSNTAYHGSVSNDTVRAALEHSHVFAYPCIWPETFCLAAVEAISSQTVVVTSNLAALPEITGGLEVMYPHSQDKNVHASSFALSLERLISMIDSGAIRFQSLATLQKKRVDLIYNWNYVQDSWYELITGLAAAR